MGSEDCLKLNVWTPNPLPSNAPVIVWFHGGSFVNASANFAPQNGLALAASSGAIIVAPNYRLGPFGYLGHAALAAEDSAAGNYGLLDQRAALTWVRDQIAGFGGNPDNITIAGAVRRRTQRRSSPGLAGKRWTVSTRHHAERIRVGPLAHGCRCADPGRGVCECSRLHQRGSDGAGRVLALKESGRRSSRTAACALRAGARDRAIAVDADRGRTWRFPINRARSTSRERSPTCR